MRRLRWGWVSMFWLEVFQQEIFKFLSVVVRYEVRKFSKVRSDLAISYFVSLIITTGLCPVLRTYTMIHSPHSKRFWICWYLSLVCQNIQTPLKCETNPCSKDAKCVNTFAGYHCKCETGFQPKMNESEAILCQDINECDLGVFSNLTIFWPYSLYRIDWTVQAK